MSLESPRAGSVAPPACGMRRFSNPERRMLAKWKDTLRRLIAKPRKEPEMIEPIPETVPVNPEPAETAAAVAPPRCLYYVLARRSWLTIALGASVRVDLYGDPREAEMRSAMLAARGYRVDVYRLPCESPEEIARRIQAGEPVSIAAQPAWGYRPGQAQGRVIGVG